MTLKKSLKLYVAGVGLMLLVGCANAARMQDWWVDVDNDRVSDVHALLDDGADPNQRTGAGNPAIMEAVRNGAWNVFDLLAADPHTNLNAENTAGETPLMYAALMGELDRVKYLVAHGAQVNRLGWTPLHYAASKAQIPVAEFLISKGAMVDAPAPDGTTPLMMAAYSGDINMVEVLLKAGANPAGVMQDGRDAKDWADKGGSTKIAALLEQAMQARRESQERQRGSSASEEGASSEAGASSDGAAQTAGGQTQVAPGAKAVQGVNGVQFRP